VKELQTLFLQKHDSGGRHQNAPDETL
jgi:hypothetical protein